MPRISPPATSPSPAQKKPSAAHGLTHPRASQCAPPRPFASLPKKDEADENFTRRLLAFVSSITASNASAEAGDEVLCVPLDGSADQSADEPAEERGSDLAPALRVERSAVMAVVVAMVVVMTRLMMLRVRRGRRRVTRYLVSGRGTHRSGMCSRGCPSWSLHRLRRMLVRSRCL